MTWLSIASLLIRLVGFSRWADSLWELHVAKRKAREIANTPTTRAELEDTLKKGDL